MNGNAGNNLQFLRRIHCHRKLLRHNLLPSQTKTFHECLLFSKLIYILRLLIVSVRSWPFIQGKTAIHCISNRIGRRRRVVGGNSSKKEGRMTQFWKKIYIRHANLKMCLIWFMFFIVLNWKLFSYESKLWKLLSLAYHAHLLKSKLIDINKHFNQTFTLPFIQGNISHTPRCKYKVRTSPNSLQKNRIHKVSDHNLKTPTYLPNYSRKKEKLHKRLTQVLIATRTTMMNLKSLKLYLILLQHAFKSESRWMESESVCCVLIKRVCVRIQRRPNRV